MLFPYKYFFKIQFRAENFLNPVTENEKQENQEKDKTKEIDDKVKRGNEDMEIKKKENGRDNELSNIKKEVEEKKEVEVDDVGSSINRKSIMKDDDKDTTKENVEEDEK